jgi:hypothetical protein
MSAEIRTYGIKPGAGGTAGPFRELADNLMRIACEAGKPWEVGQHAQTVTNSMISYRDTVGPLPGSYEITTALSSDESATRSSTTTRSTGSRP